MEAFRKLNPVLAFTASLTGLLTAIGGLLSVVLNSVVFARWGLSFLAAATASDIILSGLGLSVAVLQVALAAGALVYLVWLGASAGVDLVGRWTRHRITAAGLQRLLLAYYGLFIVPLLLLQAMRLSPAAAPEPSYLLPTDLSPLLYVVVLISSAVILADRETLLSYPRLRLIAWVGGGASFALLAAGATALATRSMSESRLLVLRSNHLGCVGARIYWVGTQSIVADCRRYAGRDREQPSLRARGIVILNRADVTMGSVEALALSPAGASTPE